MAALRALQVSARATADAVRERLADAEKVPFAVVWPRDALTQLT